MTTFEEVIKALRQVRDKFGRPVALDILARAGRTTYLHKLEPSQFDAVIAACQDELTGGHNAVRTLRLAFNNMIEALDSVPGIPRDRIWEQAMADWLETQD